MEFLVKLTTDGVCMKKEKGVSSCERTGMGGAEMYNVYFEIASMCFLLLMLIIIKLKRQLNILQNKKSPTKKAEDFTFNPTTYIPRIGQR